LRRLTRRARASRRTTLAPLSGVDTLRPAAERRLIQQRKKQPRGELIPRIDEPGTWVPLASMDAAVERSWRAFKMCGMRDRPDFADRARALRTEVLERPCRPGACYDPP
jgi:hypothetical protein